MYREPSQCLAMAVTLNNHFAWWYSGAFLFVNVRKSIIKVKIVQLGKQLLLPVQFIQINSLDKNIPLPCQEDYKITHANSDKAN